MFFQNICILVLWIKVVSALEGLISIFIQKKSQVEVEACCVPRPGLSKVTKHPLFDLCEDSKRSETRPGLHAEHQLAFTHTRWRIRGSPLNTRHPVWTVTSPNRREIQGVIITVRKIISGQNVTTLFLITYYTFHLNLIC